MIDVKRFFMILTAFLLSAICIYACANPFVCAEEISEAVEISAQAPSAVQTPASEPFAGGFNLGGIHYSIDVEEIDLSGSSGLNAKDFDVLRQIAPYAKNLKNIILGNENTSPYSWDTISQLQEALPGKHFSYDFSLYGEPMTLDTEYIDLRKIKVDDDGAAVMAALPCMKKCTYLDMDQSGVDNEHMAVIRDAFPDVKVVWRVRFTNMDYSCRTDVKTILCSLCGIGLTDDECCKPLTYCTDLVNLDAGHNNNMRTLSFLRYMPNLEVFITYNNYLRDVDDLVYCKKLKYLELFGSSMHNIDAIGELYELTDLQIGYCYNLNDISPIIPADRVPKLQRLWLTPGNIPQDQIDEFKRNHPDCIVNDTDNSVGWYWRFIDPIHEYNTPENRTPAYQKIVSIFHYGAENNLNYSFSTSDPYYTTPHGEPVVGERVSWFYG